MFALRGKPSQGDGTGFCWPNTANGTGTVKDVFGSRPYTAHIATVGYDYDFHRGVDVNSSAGATTYSPLNGSIARAHMTHFGFEDSQQLQWFSSTTPSTSLTYALGTNALTLTCSRVGSITWPTNVDFIYQQGERMNPENDDYVVEIELVSTISLAAGALGIGFVDSTTAPTEWVCLEYDGTTFRMRAKGNGVAFTLDNTTASASSKTWWRIGYTRTTDTWVFYHSTDGTTWTSIGTETTRAFANQNPYMIPVMYWRSGDTNGTPYTINVSSFNWYDSSQHIGRFGNWCSIVAPGKKVTLIHFQSISPSLKGSTVTAGTPIAMAGQTGFDTRSGRVQTEHCHVEIALNNTYEYANADALNIMSPSYLPRTNLSNNVTVTRTTGNDPDGVGSHKLTINVARNDQDFDLNKVVFTGNVAARTVDFNARTGLNSDNDIPKDGAGVYLVPAAFDANANTYSLVCYFNNANVGNTFVSYVVYDTDGTQVASG